MASGTIQQIIDTTKFNPVIFSSLNETPTYDTFAVDSGGRYIMFTVDSSDNRCGAWYVWGFSNGNIASKTIISASALTLSFPTNNRMRVTKPSGAIITYLVFMINGSQMSLV